MTQRYVLSRWKYPPQNVLLGNVFASGKPPFGPFPTIDTVSNGVHCSKALMHDLLNGIDYALAVPWYDNYKDTLFINFIKILKISIKKGTLNLNGSDRHKLETIRELYSEYLTSNGIGLDASQEIWQKLVESWVSRKIRLGELDNINERISLFFDIDIANPRVPFSHQDGIRRYPLKGKIIEIDNTNRRIIERTINGKREDTQAPLFFDYRLWLIKKILLSLRPEQLPADWRTFNFDSYALIIETPFGDFPVTDFEHFDDITNDSFTWINDISLSDNTRIFSEISEHQKCSSLNPDPACKLPFEVCFRPPYPFPVSRAHIRRTFQPWHRLLLWEKMWQGDLWNYQLLMLSREQLIERGLIEETRITSLRDSTLELEVLRANSGSLRGYERFTIIPYGTIFCGLRIEGILSRIQNQNVFFETKTPLPDISGEALVLVSPERISPLMKSEPPTFIQTGSQRDLYYLTWIGATTDQNARNRSVIQLLDSVFGDRPLRRGPE